MLIPILSTPTTTWNMDVIFSFNHAGEDDNLKNVSYKEETWISLVDLVEQSCPANLERPSRKVRNIVYYTLQKILGAPNLNLSLTLL